MEWVESNEKKALDCNWFDSVIKYKENEDVLNAVPEFKSEGD